VLQLFTVSSYSLTIGGVMRHKYIARYQTRTVYLDGKFTLAEARRELTNILRRVRMEHTASHWVIEAN